MDGKTGSVAPAILKSERTWTESLIDTTIGGEKLFIVALVNVEQQEYSFRAIRKGTKNRQ